MEIVEGGWCNKVHHWAFRLRRLKSRLLAPVWGAHAGRSLLDI